MVHSSSHSEHLKQLHELFDRLETHNLKINLKKCVFGSTNVAYLGFRLTPEGIKPGKDKLKAVGSTPPPKDARQIKQFLGLCNFFRNLVKNFAQITAPLTALTRKDSEWKNGELPPEALKAFRILQSKLCSEPILAYPRRDRQYCLITDAALGDENNAGGFGAILTQVDKLGEHHVISYASRKLPVHEKNYAPFLLEMQAACWAMDHFDNYLRGHPFTLMTDHKPLCALGKVHTRTLNRLQELMNIYTFTIEYKKGDEMPSDYLSRNAIDSISFEGIEIITEQDKDSLIGPIKRYLLNRELPDDLKVQQYIRHYAFDCFIEDDILWRRIGNNKNMENPRVVLFLPQSLVLEVIKEAHGTLVSGHDGVLKTKERILKCYFWPGMDKNILDFINSCSKCQLRKRGPHVGQALLQPLPQCSEPNQRVHVDLFGPLKTSGSGKKYILVMTDAFTKYVELVAIPDKEAKTVTSAILHKWICRFGLPMEIFSDMGGEFKNKLSEDLYEMLGTSHRTTSPRHPQCNAQVEIANKTIAKYLSSFVDKSTLDWELYLAPLMLYYNTSHHRSIKTSPFFLTFGMEPRLPNFPEPELRRKFYGESDSAEMKLRLLLARKLALENNMDVTTKAEEYTNSKVKPVDYKVNQYVLLDEHNFLGKNTKLAPKYSGPHKIIQIKNNCNAELLQKNGKKVIVHFNRLKPYTFPFYENETISKNINKSQAQEKVELKTDSTQNVNNSDPSHFLQTENVYVPQLSQTETPILFAEKTKQVQIPMRRPGRPPTAQKIVRQTHPRQARPPPPPKNPVEQGGVASRTRSRAQTDTRSQTVSMTEKGEDLNVSIQEFHGWDENTQPVISKINSFKPNKGKLIKRKSVRTKTGHKQKKRTTHTLSEKEIRSLLRKYKKKHPPSHRVVYFGPLDEVDTDSDTDSNHTLSSTSSTPVASDSEPDGAVGGAAGFHTDDDFRSADSGSSTEVDTDQDDFEDTRGTPGGAADSPDRTDRQVKGRFNRLIQQADEFLFKPYPKRNIPRKNYKE